MPLNSIVVIVIRLFVLNSLLCVLALTASAVMTPLPSKQSFLVVQMPYVPAVLMLIVAVLLWILAPVVARLVTRGVDASVSVGSLSRADLYNFAFVFLGLFFILSSIGDVINWLHYFATASQESPERDPRIQNLYQLTRPCLTLAAGLVSLLGAPRWTKKLVGREQKSEVA